MWIILSFLLVALADFYPRLALTITGLLITSVLLSNYKNYIDLGVNAGFIPSASSIGSGVK